MPRSSWLRRLHNYYLILIIHWKKELSPAMSSYLIYPLALIAFYTENVWSNFRPSHLPSVTRHSFCAFAPSGSMPWPQSFPIAYYVNMLVNILWQCGTNRDARSFIVVAILDIAWEKRITLKVFQFFRILSGGKTSFIWFLTGSASFFIHLCQRFRFQIFRRGQLWRTEVRSNINNRKLRDEFQGKLITASRKSLFGLHAGTEKINYKHFTSNFRGKELGFLIVW